MVYDTLFLLQILKYSRLIRSGSKLPAAAEGYDTLAIRSGNALASAWRLGAITRAP
jgi:hypothetical protein